jgi:hypothetical protein
LTAERANPSRKELLPSHVLPSTLNKHEKKRKSEGLKIDTIRNTIYCQFPTEIHQEDILDC